MEYNTPKHNKNVYHTPIRRSALLNFTCIFSSKRLHRNVVYIFPIKVSTLHGRWYLIEFNRVLRYISS